MCGSKTKTTASGLLTPQQAADYLGFQVGYVYRLIREGRLAYTKPFGRYVRINIADLDAAVESSRVEGWR